MYCADIVAIPSYNSGNSSYICHWESEASHTLECSIEISRYVFDSLWENNFFKSYAKMRGWNYVVQTRACSKISFGSLKRSADYLGKRFLLQGELAHSLYF